MAPNPTDTTVQSKLSYLFPKSITITKELIKLCRFRARTLSRLIRLLNLTFTKIIQ